MNKIGIAIISIITVLAIIIVILCVCLNNKQDVQYIFFSSLDNKYKVSIPNNLDYKSVETSNYSLNLYSKKYESYIYGSSIFKMREINLYDLILNDKNTFIDNPEHIINSSDITPISICDFSGYEYTIEYFDSDYNGNFYSNVVWIETDDYIYVLNFEIKLENIDNTKLVLNDIKNSLTF